MIISSIAAASTLIVLLLKIYRRSVCIIELILKLFTLLHSFKKKSIRVKLLENCMANIYYLTLFKYTAGQFEPQCLYHGNLLNGLN